jgi:hypothetical protein
MATQMIRLILLDGDPDGLRSASIAGRTTVVWACPWVQMKSLLKRPDAARPGVYFMVGTPTPGATFEHDQTIYIGECDSPADRFSGKHHQQDAAEWSQIFLATTTEGTFNKAHARHAEDRLVGIVKAAGRAHCLNGGTSPGKVDEGDYAFAADFVTNVVMLAQTLGLSLFRSAVSSSSKDGVLVNTLITASLPIVFKFAYTGTPLDARMILDGSEFVIQAGSHARAKDMPGLPDLIRSLRTAARDSGVLVDGPSPGLQAFTKDYPMKSPSGAGSMVYGSACAGPIAWRHAQTNQTYKEWLTEQTETTNG